MIDFLNSYQFVNIFGLSFDIVGVVILFFTGLPFKIPERNLVYEEEITPEQIKKDKSQKRLAFLGLLLLIIGFSFQIWSSILSI